MNSIRAIRRREICYCLASCTNNLILCQHAMLRNISRETTFYDWLTGWNCLSANDEVRIHLKIVSKCASAMLFCTVSSANTYCSSESECAPNITHSKSLEVIDWLLSLLRRAPIVSTIISFCSREQIINFICQNLFIITFSLIFVYWGRRRPSSVVTLHRRRCVAKWVNNGTKQ